MIFLEDDDELAPWIYGLVHHEPTKPGDFLASVGEAAARADPENYDILRPALIKLMAKYPKYRCEHWKGHWRKAQ